MFCSVVVELCGKEKKIMESKKWNLMALRCGHMYRDQSLFTCEYGAGNMIDQPFWSVAIWNDEHKILFDTAVNKKEWIANRFKNSKTMNPNCKIVLEEEDIIYNKIKKLLNWDADDVDMVIHSHLHWDHALNDFAFKKAAFYAQKKEWEIANEVANTADPSKVYYVPETFDQVPYLRWEFLDGETTILPGLIAFPTPGHTAGHQSLLVDTEEGLVCLTGDAVYLRANLEMNILPCIVASADDMKRAFNAIRGRADYIIPGHDDEIKDGQTNGFIKVVKRKLQ